MKLNGGKTKYVIEKYQATPFFVLFMRKTHSSLLRKYCRYYFYIYYKTKQNYNAIICNNDKI